jgi:hypothetical protein
MATDSLDASGGTDCARKALANVRASSDQLQASLSDAFDRLNQLADEMLAHELNRQHAEWQALDGRIEQLTTLVAELTGPKAVGQRFAGGRGRP